MTIRSVLMIAVLIVGIGATTVRAQSTSNIPAVEATPAYEVLIIERAAVKAGLVQRQQMLTSQHPDVMQIACELNYLNMEIDRLLTVEAVQIPKLSSVYGNLILRKVELEVQQHSLRQQFTPTHPEVRNKRIELQAIQQELDALLR